MISTFTFTQLVSISVIINILLLLNININIDALELSYYYICVSLIVYNCILINDILFHFKYLKRNITLTAKFYPSGKYYIQTIWTLNTYLFVFSSLLYSYYNQDNYYNVKKILTLFLSVLSIIYIYYIIIKYCIKLYYFFKNSINQMIYNYEKEYPLFANVMKINKIDNYMYCGLCNQPFHQNQLVKKINCDCNYYFHGYCIDTYMGMYNNICFCGHRVPKYEHTA